MELKQPQNKAKIYLFKANICLIVQSNSDGFKGVFNDKIGLNNVMFINNHDEINAIPYEKLSQDLRISYFVPVGGQMDFNLFEWLYRSGIDFVRSPKGKYSFLLLGAQLKELINQLNAR